MSDDSYYYTFGKRGPDPDAIGESVSAAEPVFHSNAGYMSTSYPSGGPGRISVRQGSSRADYNYWRPNEAVPVKYKQAIITCDEVYKHNPIVYNVINLMADFASQGIEIFHPSKTKEKRYRHWFRKVGGKYVSERFLNLFYRQANVVVKRAFADLNTGDIDDLQHGVAGRKPKPDADIEYQRHPTYFKNRIPLQYTFLSPSAIEVIGGELAMFTGQIRYGLKVPQPIINAIKNPKTADERELVKKLPEWVVRPIRQGKKVIPLDPEKVEVYHYKKDDWQQWAYPMIYPILSDIKLYDKMKLADAAALDGAISRVTLWRVGLPEHKIMPGPKALKAIHDMLAANAANGGSMDLVWDATLDFKETSTEVYKFLGMQKYEPVLKAIYAGLGIPQTLTGGGQGGQGMTNNALSLKTLMERLQYGRDVLMEFWEKELHILQEAFGDAQPARIHFENMTMNDEAAEKMLWIQLVDRDILSVETMQEKFGQIPEIEQRRLRREYEARKKDEMPEKLGPFVEVAPNPDATAVKGLQTGLLAPTEVPKMKKKNKDKGDKSLLDRQEQQDEKRFKLEEKSHEQDMQFKREEQDMKLKFKEQESKIRLKQKKENPAGSPKAKGRPGQGRPKNSKDTTVRKKRVDKPRQAKAAYQLFELQAWAKAAQKSVSDIVNPNFLKQCKKKSIRSLTASEAAELDRIKVATLSGLEPFTPVTADTISGLEKIDPSDGDELAKAAKSLLTEMGMEDTVDNMRDMIASAYAMLRGEHDNGEASDGD